MISRIYLIVIYIGVFLFLCVESVAQFQKSNMKIAYYFEDEVTNVILPPKYLKYSINKNKTHFQFKEICFILIYKDSLLITKFEQNKIGEIEKKGSLTVFVEL
jgi:hypothetical protein